MKSSVSMIEPHEALEGRATPIVVNLRHLTFGTSLYGPFPEGAVHAYFAMGCFWGAERIFFASPGVLSTSVGYQGGFTPNPTYQEVCSGLTGHSEAVHVVFDPAVISYDELLSRFFESHDPTQGFRQGADVGTQYRSAIYTTSPEQLASALLAKAAFTERLASAGLAAVTTEIAEAATFYMAEDYHQQYLVANPAGYCGLGGTGVSCPVGLWN
jgi:peptide-methionine (S)-S-oxide reductase